MTETDRPESGTTVDAGGHRVQIERSADFNSLVRGFLADQDG
jgi:hypothetical protein